MPLKKWIGNEFCRGEGSFLRIFSSGCIAFLFFNLNAFAAEESPAILGFGIVFPAISQASNLNPAGLVQSSQFLVGMNYGPSLSGSSQSYGGELEWSTGSFGLGGTVSDSTSSYSSSLNWSGGAAFQVQAVKIGMGLSGTSTVSPVSYASPPNVSMGVIYTGDSTQFGAVLNGLSGGAPQLSLGIGGGEKGRFNLEADLQLPSFSNFIPGVFNLTFAGSIFVNDFGLSFAAISSFMLGSTPGSSQIISASSPLLTTKVAGSYRPFKSIYVLAEVDGTSTLLLSLNFLF